MVTIRLKSVIGLVRILCVLLAAVMHTFNCLIQPPEDPREICHLKHFVDGRFIGRDFLERERGKKIMFVGDSLSKNMWQSLTCALHSAVSGSKYDLTEQGKLSTFSIPV